MKLNFNIVFNFFDVKVNIVSVLAFTILLSFFFPKTGNAASFQLSGRITDNTYSPIVNTNIYVINENTGILIAHTLSDKNGYYNIIIDSGSYIIRVSSQKSSKSTSDIILKQTISKDTVLNVIFAPNNSNVSNNYFYDLITNPLYK